MEATNAELYALVLADAPYVIAAYAIIWLALMGYVTAVLIRMQRIQKSIDVLASAMQAKGISVVED